MAEEQDTQTKYVNSSAHQVFLICFFVFGGSDEEPKQADTISRDDLSLPNGEIYGHEYVDLGLPSGLKWATCNVGASKPEENGDYFAWGETKTKSSYDDKNTETYIKDIEWLRSKDYIGENRNLTLSHDAARQNWGGTWRMPTLKEIEELENNTTTKWVTLNGVEGRLVKSRNNGNTIFLPAAGCRFSRRSTMRESTAAIGARRLARVIPATPTTSASTRAISARIGATVSAVSRCAPFQNKAKLC